VFGACEWCNIQVFISFHQLVQMLRWGGETLLDALMARFFYVPFQ